MARKKKAPEGSAGAPLYMATYGDMVTLILCFFVLLFAMSSVDAQKFQSMAGALQRSLGILKGQPMPEEPRRREDIIEEKPEGGQDVSPIQPPAPEVDLDTQNVSHMINSYLRLEGLDKQIQAVVDQRGVVVSMSDQFLFESGSAELKSDGRRVLFKIAEIVRNQVPAISVEGHTNSVPLRGGIYRDNWGLSAARAAGVASFLENEGKVDSHKLQAVGYASSRPTVPNDTPEHRALNRRVDLVFMSQYPKK